MTKKHDWTKLTNGWVREPACIRLDNAYGTVVRVYDDGYLQVYGLESPERTLELLTEAVTQRAKCAVAEPRFKFGDWVQPRGRWGKSRVVQEPERIDGEFFYTTHRPVTLAVRGYWESDLEPCDPPGDGGGE